MFGLNKNKDKDKDKDKDIKNIIKNMCKKKNNTEDAEKVPLTSEQKTERMSMAILGVCGAFTLIFAAKNVYNVVSYDPSINSVVDTTALDNIKSFIASENTDKYEEVIRKHTDESKNDKLDIKNVYSAIGREYPFSNILNKNQDVKTTKICKFIHNELKPAIISYYKATGKYPLTDSEDDANKVDLSLIRELLNLRDKELESYDYYMTDFAGSSEFGIVVKNGEKIIPIVLFNPSSFTIKELNSEEVNLVQGKYSVILKPMEEFNNIRLQNISVTKNSKSCTLVDTITGETVKIAMG